ncbi:MAG: hypothetical protein ABW321_11345 [Polyangiales bacterium]
MTRVVLVALVVLVVQGALAVLLPPSAAQAEELGNRRNLVFSAERLFGFYIDNVTVDAGGRSDTTHHSVIAVGWTSSPGLLGVPRLGIDYFVTSALTVGGQIGVFSRNDAGRTSTGVLVGARAGYALRLGHAVSFWLRGGFTYSRLAVEDVPSDSYLLALTLEAPLTIALADGFGILVGPTLELGFVGERVGRDASELLFGLMFGLAGWTGL